MIRIFIQRFNVYFGMLGWCLVNYWRVLGCEKAL
jgi:hypothetical protein